MKLNGKVKYGTLLRSYDDTEASSVVAGTEYTLDPNFESRPVACSTTGMKEYKAFISLPERDVECVWISEYMMERA